MNRIGIVYMATGYYCCFWKEFYTSCETFFCVDAKKGYEVFTDSAELLNTNIPNVTFHAIEDKGWIINVSSKSEFICSISERLRINYDYVYYLNGNFRCLKPINSQEILPEAKNGYFAALSFLHNRHKSPDQYDYDRNANSHAFVPSGKGKRYYQASFYGGRTEELLKFSEWSREMIHRDMSNGIIARYHDESYLNCYLQDAVPLVLSDVYGYSDFTQYNGEYKAELINKNLFLGINLLHARSLLPASQVKLQGELGDQMFCFAFYCYLKKYWLDGRRKPILSLPPTDVNLSGSLYDIFPLDITDDIKIVEQQLRNIPEKDIVCVTEMSTSVIQQIKEYDTSIVVYDGKWQCYQYADTCENELRKTFQFPLSQLSERSKELLNKIQNCECPVSIHIPPHAPNTYKSLLLEKISENYYERAIHKLSTSLPCEPVFFYFRDETTIEKRWEDMYLISQCKHHIIANNSFSWWGAWLGTNNEKLVIAPHCWDIWEETPDLLPPSWIKLPINIENNQLNDFVRQLFFNRQGTDNLGLYNGKMGIALFFFHAARSLNNIWYEEYAEELLDEIFEDIHCDIPIDFATGICGIGWGIEYLIQHGYATGCSDNILSELDKKVVEKDLRRIGDASLEHGLKGIVRYVNARLSSPREVTSALPFDSLYLNELKETCARLNVELTEHVNLDNILNDIKTYYTKLLKQLPTWLELYIVINKVE